MTCDGQVSLTLKPGDSVLVRKKSGRCVCSTRRGTVFTLVVEINSDGLMHSRPDITTQWRQAPVTISILAISTVVFALMSLFGDAIILDWLAFNKVEFNGRRFELVSPGSEYWRYVTPALIHFGLIHILFNGLWIWEFGSRLELRLGSIFTLNLFLAGSIGGNLPRAGGAVINFGGLSGVVYAYMGCLWVMWRLRPGLVPIDVPAVFTFMWIWLFIGFTGILKTLGLGSIANGAHRAV